MFIIMLTDLLGKLCFNLRVCWFIRIGSSPVSLVVLGLVGPLGMFFHGGGHRNIIGQGPAVLNKALLVSFYATD